MCGYKMGENMEIRNNDLYFSKHLPNALGTCGKPV